MVTDWTGNHCFKYTYLSNVCSKIEEQSLGPFLYLDEELLNE